MLRCFAKTFLIHAKTQSYLNFIINVILKCNRYINGKPVVTSKLLELYVHRLRTNHVSLWEFNISVFFVVMKRLVHYTVYFAQ